MAKLSYPQLTLPAFEKEYADEIIRLCSKQKSDIESFLLHSGIIVPMEEFFTLPFEKILSHAKILKSNLKKDMFTFSPHYSKTISEYKDIFDYSRLLQSSISPFFMKNSVSMNIRTCCYCNIDFVNSYIPFKNDYRDFLDLINVSNLDDLKKIKGITSANAKNIQKLCKGHVKTLADLTMLLQSSRSVLNLLLKAKNSDGSIKFDSLKDKKNHYTLDHILPQSKFPFFSLCLYNLVPSCYTCNSKLKGSKMLTDDFDMLSKISPTSNSYENPLKFRLLYKDTFSRKNLPSESNQYNIELETKNSYTELLNLQGRYNFHKNESLKLIKQRKIYSDSQIVAFSKFLKMDVIEIKKHLFGTSLFENDSNEPFDRYKKDIAKELGII
ncbi:hypothetical protein A0O34_21420 [Chryseobacterium glaciei]|uniref:Uncharacterized protein n=1 Tax=Chryseobacterium glaciei TaxID=1685010 RepID=A0A172Y1E1_9FLAO|nr:HNH endonuclease domain-containing protein [Chryseobacterium glaciei]ANF52922.1 hypothetical protein A0O34_21420 [Chryseobacterium glaciei]